MEEKTLVGYHTTDIDSLNSIMQNGFEMSEPMSKHWLGKGVYFFIDLYYAVEWKIIGVLKKYNIEASICTGLSLGEYTALIYSGYISLEDGIKLIQKRGYYMQNNVPNEEFKMAAVIGLDSKKIEEVCNDIDGFVVPANYNYSNQTVISGNKGAVEQAIDKLKDAGARKVVELKTSGPFHTKKLIDAKKEYEKELEKVELKAGTIPVIKNIDGNMYNKEDNIKQILSNHIISPVRFDKTIKTMENEKIDTYIEVGPGKTLTGFVKKENKEANVLNIFDLETLESALEKYSKKEK